MNDDDDCWDAFGSDDDSDGDEVADDSGDTEEKSLAAAVALHLSKSFLAANAEIRMEDRVVRVTGSSNAVGLALKSRGISVVTEEKDGDSMFDAAVIMDPSDKNGEKYLSSLVPGGILISHSDFVPNKLTDFNPSTEIWNSGSRKLFSHLKRATRVHESTCPWLPSSHSIPDEQTRVESATVALSVHEARKGIMTNSSIERAVRSMNSYGYCIIRGLLDEADCREWGGEVLASVAEAAKILLDRDQVDIYHPHTSKFEPQAYRELSMREDLRLDIRHGPPLSQRRAQDYCGNEELVISAETRSFQGFLRGNESILDVMRRTMNPKKGDLYKGNLGRFNFGGKGADGSFQDLRLSRIGGIVSLPGSADQAMHADTPHLFEHIPNLPAHYINVFAPGTPFHERVGGTAFVHKSHTLDFTAEHCGSTDNYKAVYPYLVRPRLTLGDVVLFDCRILHFGMANQSDSVERVMLYTNATQAWFTDPKNWDDRRRIFED